MIKNFYNKYTAYISVALIICLVYGLESLYEYQTTKPLDMNVELINNEIIVTYSGPEDCYIMVSSEKPKASDDGYKKIENYQYSFDLIDEPVNYYIKFRNRVYYAGNNDNLGYLTLDTNIDKYLILGNNFDFSKYLTVSGYFSNEINYTTTDENVLVIDKGIINTVGNGTATVTATLNNSSVSYDFIVTDLIQEMPTEFDTNKELLQCGRYTKEENDLLDEILEYRINQAGYQTRGAVVATTRFLLLEFPYRLTYFYEYGRQNYDNVDGEGRYYIKGLYLDESRFSGLIGSNTGPATWGCTLYSVVLSKDDINGLDCSGFVTWALLNSGYDCGEIGSGFSEYYDLTETGQLVKNSLSVIKDVKAGDLVHSNYMGGHIGIVAGITDKNVYVAQATPKNNWGVTITKYEYKDFVADWSEIVFMDSYYKEEGNYTNMW